MPVVGTAGHVDHGKTTLIKALTGRDTDRFAEEKERGLTIDLGFAWTLLPGGLEVGFVDVPGHERFVKNMLAGVDGIDAALLVVAADEGWMPQTEEHVAILDQMGVAHGVVALTRTDLVDEDTRDIAALEVASQLEGTSLDGATIVPTAAPTGAGIAELEEALAAAVTAAPEPADRGRPRLWVDRSFVIAGAGTVVTGTMLGGRLAVGDTITVWPGEWTSRVRGIESHEETVTEAIPGRRTALNLSGLERRQIARGAVVGRAGDWRLSNRALVAIRTVRSHPDPLTERGAYHCHLGSGAFPARLRLQGRRISGLGYGLLELEPPLPVAAGDRFVLRDVGRRAVIAGGRVLDPGPPSRTASALAAAAELEAALEHGADAVARALLDLRGMDDAAGLAAASGGGALPAPLVVNGIGIAPDTRAAIADRAAALTAAYHEEEPLRPGIPRARLASELGIAPDLLVTIIEGDERLRSEEAVVRRAEFEGRWEPHQERQWAEAANLLAAGLAVPRASALGVADDLLHAAVRLGLAILVGDDLVYLPDQIEEITARMRELPDGFTVSQFRQHFGLSRRHAVPLLEWFDQAGVTVRRGDERRLKSE